MIWRRNEIQSWSSVRLLNNSWKQAKKDCMANSTVHNSVVLSGTSLPFLLLLKRLTCDSHALATVTSIWIFFFVVGISAKCRNVSLTHCSLAQLSQLIHLISVDAPLLLLFSSKDGQRHFYSSACVFYPNCESRAQCYETRTFLSIISCCGKEL